MGRSRRPGVRRRTDSPRNLRARQPNAPRSQRRLLADAPQLAARCARPEVHGIPLHPKAQSSTARTPSNAPRALLSLLGVVTALVACSGSGREDDDSCENATHPPTSGGAAGTSGGSSGSGGFAGSQTRAPSISNCTGTYSCNLYGPPNEFGADDWEFSPDATLVGMDGACTVELTLWAGRSFTFDLSSAYIQTNTFRFTDISVSNSRDDESLICWSPSATCTGKAQSCYSVGLNYCTYQDDCDVNLHSLLSLDDDECEGDVTKCSDLTDQLSCQWQRGCAWQ